MFWIGLQTEGPYVKWAKLQLKNKKIHIEELKTVPLSLDVKPLYFSLLPNSSEKFSLISGLTSKETLIRSLQLNLQNKEKITKSIPFQIETQIPYPQEEAVSAIQITEDKFSKTSKATLFISKIQNLLSHLDFWEKYQIDPEQTSCFPEALSRFTHHFFPHLNQALIFHISLDGCTALFIKKSEVIFSHPFSLDPEQITKDPKQLEKELRRLFSFLLKKIEDTNGDSKKEEAIKLLILGNLSSFVGLKEMIGLHLPSEIELEEKKPIYEIEPLPYDSTTLESYAIPIGLALDALKEDGRSIEFRQKNFTSQTAEKKRIKKFLSLALASTLLTLTTICLSYVNLTQKKEALSSYLEETFSLKRSLETFDDLKEELFQLENSIDKKQMPYALTPSFPDVSETLAYLSTYPSSFEIKKIHYALVKYPKVGSSKTPYVGKIHLQIEIVNEAEAEKFQKTLLKENTLVDTTKEFIWEKNEGYYSTSFFLKPKTGSI